MKRIKHIEENVPFEWEQLEYDLKNLLYFNPSNPDSWNEFLYWMEDTYSESELLSVKDKIIEFENNRLKEIKKDELSRAKSTINNMLYYNQHLTKDDLINLINNMYE